jgi:hypothetical protein
MSLLKPLCIATVIGVTIAASTGPADAQASPAPGPTSPPTFMDRLYDGHTHVMLAPYIWGPTVKANFQFAIPRLSPHSRLVSSTVDIGPSDYLPKLNSAGMAAFDVRTGNFDVFGDGIYLNASTTATIYSTISGPFGFIKIPVRFNSSARLSWRRSIRLPTATMPISARSWAREHSRST